MDVNSTKSTAPTSNKTTPASNDDHITIDHTNIQHKQHPHPPRQYSPR
jgi:hypothetical protein